jgi:hypothetical protein
MPPPASSPQACLNVDGFEALASKNRALLLAGASSVIRVTIAYSLPWSGTSRTKDVSGRSGCMPKRELITTQISAAMGNVAELLGVGQGMLPKWHAWRSGETKYVPD